MKHVQGGNSMYQKSTYMQRLSNVAWKLLKYIRRLALAGCILFTAVFWIACAIAASQGLLYRFQFWKFGIGMTLITLAAVVAVVVPQVVPLGQGVQGAPEPSGEGDEGQQHGKAFHNGVGAQALHGILPPKERVSPSCSPGPTPP